MSCGELMTALSAVVDRVVRLSHEDAGLRRDLHRLAQALLDTPETAPDEAPASIRPVTRPDETAADRDVTTSQEITSGPREVELPRTNFEPAALPTPSLPEPILPEPGGPLPELTLGRPAPPPVPAKGPIPAAKAAEPAKAAVDCTSVPEWIRRLEFKAEACRWGAERLRKLRAGGGVTPEIAARDRDFLQRGRNLGMLRLWMLELEAVTDAAVERIEWAAGCYANVASALTHLHPILTLPEVDSAIVSKGLHLLAEAQSALRLVVMQLGGGEDPDQAGVFACLSQATKVLRIFVGKYMKLNEPADPSRWEDVARRLAEFGAGDADTVRKRKGFAKALNKIRYETGRILADDPAAPEAWKTVLRTTDELISAGMPPSNRELRELLLPVIERVPDDLPLSTHFVRVRTEIDRAAACEPDLDDAGPAVPAPEIQAAAELLAGRKLVMIGGVRRPHNCTALEKAFGLAELDWLETREHQSIEGFEPHVAKADVAAVILAVRWSSHSFGDVKQFCDKYDKPLVHLPAGYNPRQVAVQILAQISGRLG